MERKMFEFVLRERQTLKKMELQRNSGERMSLSDIAIRRGRVGVLLELLSELDLLSKYMTFEGHEQ